jgi:glycosyltransferase involved in cell wall biosynthesis
MRKIIHIITRLDMGGSAQNTLLTCIGLAREGYRVILIHGLSIESRITREESLSVEDMVQMARNQGVEIVPLPHLVRRLDPLKDFLAWANLLRLLAAENPDIVHTHTSKAGILGRIAAWTARIPCIIHTPHGHVFYGHFGHLTSRSFLAVERLVAFITHKVVALTEAERDDYIACGLCRPEKIAVIHSGVDVGHYMKAEVDIRNKKSSLGLNPGFLVVGTVGWLLPIKGPMILLEAMQDVWKGHPEVDLIFVGKGELEGQLRAEAHRIGGGDRVKFLGWRSDIPEIMRLLDIFVLPSLNEGMGRVVVEAMAAGRPVVASGVGGILDLVKHRQNGLLVEPGNVYDLSFAIKELLADKELRYEMGLKGRTMARNFGVEKMLEKINELYYSLLNR